MGITLPKKPFRTLVRAACAAALASASLATFAADKPNIVVIFGDDIGYWNLSTYSQGMMGYQTPNIDSIANDGAKFTDYYAQQSCTAGRSAFITGQMPVRTGLTKVGLPGSNIGISEKDPTMATMLKELGYATAQFGKNHLGDRDEFLPTNHGFDEFFGNLYHLNAEEEPENEDYPTDPEFRKKFGPRGVLKSYADGRVENTGPLTRKRMETVDEEFLAAAKDFMTRQAKEDVPFFTWINTTRMHNHTHVRDENRGKTGLGEYADGVIEHDYQIGEVLKTIDDLGIEDNTIVIYTTDNGPMINLWPDAAMAPFRSEKNTGWEGGFRAPAMVKWPGHIEPGTIINDIFASEDWFPTLLAAAGNPDVKQQLLEGTSAQGKDYKVHLDGYDQTELLTGKGPSKRESFFYWSDDGDLFALRHNRWKFHFNIQTNETGLAIWMKPLTKMRVPMIYDLKNDPFERGDTGIGYDRWLYDRSYLLMGVAIPETAKMLQTFKEFPPRFKPASFTVDVSQFIE
ncbi:arylsulfatase [Marinobacterium nitratireducens]|uniref:Arylsulfatase n=1 Tax=Marinobacterium nitratireducens TaxID=518897 RepID=A0A918DRH1_9GAMM|nr:arylsulfatase [Marinobacterium nitratireducens]GGO78927.1 arylsulfatase [Marinobacterium nitratireducens]